MSTVSRRPAGAVALAAPVNVCVLSIATPRPRACGRLVEIKLESKSRAAPFARSRNKTGSPDELKSRESAEKRRLSTRMRQQGQGHLSKSGKKRQVRSAPASKSRRGRNVRNSGNRARIVKLAQRAQAGKAAADRRLKNGTHISLRNAPPLIKRRQQSLSAAAAARFNARRACGPDSYRRRPGACRSPDRVQA